MQNTITGNETALLVYRLAVYRKYLCYGGMTSQERFDAIIIVMATSPVDVNYSPTKPRCSK